MDRRDDPGRRHDHVRPRRDDLRRQHQGRRRRTDPEPERHDHTGAAIPARTTTRSSSANGATINNNGTFNDANAFASFIEHNTGGPHNFNNIGTYNKQSNTITTVDLGVVFNNSGTLNLDAGTMRFFSSTQGPTGTVNVASGATYQHDANSTMGTLHTAGNLNLGANTLTIFGDYDNANFGSGNAFNRRANVAVTGAGNRLIAAGDANQGISGAGVVNGNTAAPTLQIGNVHVGSTTYSYNIVNTGTTGPALRGAIQTSVNGGNITDPRLSGSGVTAGNWGPLATGGSLSRDVVVTVGAAGSLAPLTGQSVAIVNNFENTRSQVVTFGLAAGAAAYRLADPGIVAPVAFGNVHVGDVVSRNLTISNLAPNDGFSERLNASFGSANDPRITFAGAVNGLGAGSSNTSGMTVGLNTAAAGGVNGAVVVNFASDGAGTSGLGVTALPSQSVGVTGTIEATGSVFRLASASPAAPNPVSFGNVRVGSVAQQALTIANTAANDGFSERLNASIGGATAGVTAAGSFSGLAPQASNSSSLVVGIDTASAGVRNGTATISLASDGTGTSGLGVTPLTAQTVAVNGTVYRLANPTLAPPSLTLAARVGDAAPVASLSVANASPDAFTERLNAAFGAVSAGFTGIRLDHRPGGRRDEQRARRRPRHRRRRRLQRHGRRQLRLQRCRHDGRRRPRVAGPERRPRRPRVHAGGGAGEHDDRRLRHRPPRRCGRGPRRVGDQLGAGLGGERHAAGVARHGVRGIQRRRNAVRPRRGRDRREQPARRPEHRERRRLRRHARPRPSRATTPTSPTSRSAARRSPCAARSTTSRKRR